jgi:16S rRNA (adenine1518-N6/adenine1519-N6)-dimethyltransferase
VQKEVAENVIAKPGRLNLLAISVQLYGECEILQKVPARDFYPAPKVDSAVLQIKLHDKPRYEIGDEKKFFKILRACFTGKRKQIHNTLHNNLKLEKQVVESILKKTKIPATARPQELSIEEWIKLTKEIQDNNLTK